MPTDPIHQKPKSGDILYPFSGVQAICLPVGRPPRGTCEYATDICLKECAAFKNATPENISGYEFKNRTHKYLIERSIFAICDKIMGELQNEPEPKILYWFGAGDCPKNLTDKIISIILHLSQENIIHCGFTRNRILWNKVKGGTKICLTVEKQTGAPTGGLIAIPNYDSCTVTIYSRKKIMGDCGGDILNVKLLNIDDINSNCRKCFNSNDGCFNEGKI